jgi:hypothetical protein
MEGTPLLQSYNKRNYVQPINSRHDIHKDIELERFQDDARSRSTKFEGLSDTETESIIKIQYPPKNKAVDDFVPASNMDIDPPKYRLQPKGTETIKSISSVDEFNLPSIALSPTIGLLYTIIKLPFHSYLCNTDMCSK